MLYTYISRHLLFGLTATVVNKAYFLLIPNGRQFCASVRNHISKYIYISIHIFVHTHIDLSAYISQPLYSTYMYLASGKRRIYTRRMDSSSIVCLAAVPTYAQCYLRSRIKLIRHSHHIMTSPVLYDHEGFE
jgi:hypothetical protein